VLNRRELCRYVKFPFLFMLFNLCSFGYINFWWNLENVDDDYYTVSC